MRKYWLELDSSAHQELGGTGQAPNRQEVVARRRRLAAKQARRVRARDGTQQRINPAHPRR
ncbi:MAG: hypothetical protein RBU37_10705 [Myxococcota bacterium]|nr:hypothetical protein [Myxococcota bacterium]